MVRIEKTLMPDEKMEDTASVDAILALCFVKQFEGSGCADVDVVEKQLSHGVLEMAMQRGLLTKQHGSYVITHEGEKVYDRFDRHGADYKINL